MLHANRFDVFSSARLYQSRARWQSDHDGGEKEDNLLDQVVKSCANKALYRIKTRRRCTFCGRREYKSEKSFGGDPAISTWCDCSNQIDSFLATIARLRNNVRYWWHDLRCGWILMTCYMVGWNECFITKFLMKLSMKLSGGFMGAVRWSKITLILTVWKRFFEASKVAVNSFKKSQ